MAEYPNNSHSAREKSTATAAGKTEKKLDKVVTGAAKTKKKSEARRFLNIFAPDDAENVKSSILSDVIVPGVNAAIADVISIVLFGDTGRIGGRKSGGSRIAYQKYYDDRRDDRREYGRPRAAVGFEYDDIIFETGGTPIWCWTSWSRLSPSMRWPRWRISTIWPALPAGITRPTATAGRIFNRPRWFGRRRAM